MKKYLSALLVTFIVITTISIIFAFKPGTDKIGKRLTAVLENTNNDHFVVWVYLKDKGPDAEQLLTNPLNLVSQRSIDRRLKVKSPENVVDMTDVPVYNDYVKNIFNNVKKIRHRSKWLNAVSVEVNRTQLYHVADLDYVKKIEIVERYFKKKEDVELIQTPEEINNSTNDDPMLDSLNYGTSNAVVQITQIKVNQVHNQGIFGQGVIVASFDAGFSNLGHEVFTTLPMNIMYTWDFHTNTPSLGSHSHGTATLSLVGGYKPGKLIGPAFKSSFILARTEVTPGETPVEMDNWIAAAEWVDSLGADIITSSLSYLTFDAPYPDYTWQDMDGNSMPITIGADLAVNKGIIVSNSAGNSGYNSSHNTLGGPADGDSVITVGSVTSTGSRSSFSSVGPTTDTPPRIKPDVMAMGSSNYVASTISTSSYKTGSGTSYSCPLTSGVCALILSANKSLTPIQVRGILRHFGSRSTNPDNLYGWGIIDAKQSVDSARKLDNTPPMIQHTQPFTMTLNTGVITMGAKITDNGIIRSWTNEAPLLYFRKNTGSGWSSYTSVNVYSNVADSFYFQIPGSSLGTQVEYYFAAQDIALPTPKMSTLPAGGNGINPPGTTSPPAGFLFSVGTTGITSNGEIPTEYKLYNNYPNPFNPSTKIKFDIPKSSLVKLTVYDIIGKEVETLFNGNLNVGTYNVEFTAENLSSGIYFYRIESVDFIDTKKMIFIK